VWHWLAAGLGLVCLLLAAALLLRPPVRTPYRVAQVTYSGHVLTNDLDVESFSSSASDGTRIYFSHMDNGNPVLAVALAANRRDQPLQAAFGDWRAADRIALRQTARSWCVRSHLQAEPEHLYGLCRRWAATRAGFPTAGSRRHMDAGRAAAAGGERQRSDRGGRRRHDPPQALKPPPAWPSWLRCRLTDAGCATRSATPAADRGAVEVNADGSNAHPLLPG